jgi:protein-disulfide reductase (glutathione)
MALRGLAVLLFSAVVALSVAADTSLAAGWGDAYDWQSFEDAKRSAAQRGTGTMMVIWKTWCGACKALRPNFAGSAELVAAVKDSGFAITNLADDAEPAEEAYKSDGSYIPRIVFLDAAGQVLPAISGNAKYKHFFNSIEDIVSALNTAASLAAGKGEL